MQLQELKNQLVSGQTLPAYIFTGEEVAIMDIYIKKIAETSKTQIKRADSLASIYNKLQYNGFITSINCFIIRDDKEYLTQEKAWQQLNQGVTQGKNIIIFVYTSIDKRSKFYKQHQEQIVTFEKLPSTILAKYIQKEIGLSVDLGSQLATLCDNNYSRILLECDKIKHLSDANNWDIVSTYKTAVKTGLIYTAPTDAIFSFIDAACKRQPTLAFKLFEEITAGGESPLVMISLLYNNLRAMLLVQSSGNTTDIQTRTGLTAWQVKTAKDKGNRYSVGELVRALRLIRETEQGIKTGTIETDLAVPYILVNLM